MVPFRTAFVENLNNLDIYSIIGFVIDEFFTAELILNYFTTYIDHRTAKEIRD